MIPTQDNRRASLHELSSRDRAAAETLADLKAHGTGHLSLSQVDEILEDLSRRLAEVATFESLSEGYLPAFRLKQRYALSVGIPVDIAGVSQGAVFPGIGSVVRSIRSLGGGGLAVLDTGGRLQVVTPRSDGTWSVEQPFDTIKFRVCEALPCGGLVGILHDSCLLVAPRTKHGEFNAHVFTKPAAYLEGTYGLQRHTGGFYVYAQDRIGEWYDNGVGYSYRDVILSNGLRCAHTVGRDSFVASSANRQLMLWSRSARSEACPNYIETSGDFIVGLGPLSKDLFYSVDIGGHFTVYQLSDDERHISGVEHASVSTGVVLGAQHTRCGRVVVYTSEGVQVLQFVGGQVEIEETVELARLHPDQLEARRVTALHVAPSGVLAIAQSGASGRNSITLWDENAGRNAGRTA